MQEAIHAFLLAFPALFSIVNPISGTFIFGAITADRLMAERGRLAGKVALYSLLVMMGALWAGSFVLAFFGITLAALRVAGGLVVALTGWSLLNAPEHRDARKQEQAASATEFDDIALFPLTIPITTGPGTISVAVALSASRPRTLDGFAGFFVGLIRRRDRSGAGDLDHLPFDRSHLTPDGTDGQPYRHATVRFPAALHRRADPDHRRGGCAGSVAGPTLRLQP